MQYFINLDGQSIGPMTIEQMTPYNITPNTPVSRDGGPWAPLYTYPELMQFFQQRMAAYQNASEQDVNSKKMLCGILAILVGSLGVQYFVLGKIAGGFITILLSIVTCGLWSLLTLAQGIYMLCITDQEFKAKYMDSTSTLPLF